MNTLIFTPAAGAKQPNHKVVIFEDASNAWAFNIVARNGKILCHGHGYNTRISVLKTAKTFNYKIYEKG